MPLWRGAKLAGSLLLAPSGAGAGVHLLNTFYRSIMTFDGEFFIVEAIEELYDDGIPKIPEEVMKDAKQVAQKLEQAKEQQQQQQQQQANGEGVRKQEVFSNKKYWCRFFDYKKKPLGQTGIEDVTMKYDRNCKIFKIFPVKEGENQVKQVSSEKQKNSLTPQVFGISQINKKSADLKASELKNNYEFQKGGFYLLQLDKNKIPGVNPMFKIELSETPSGKANKYSEQTYHKKITTLQVRANLTGDTTQKVDFQFKNSLPSSLLLVKKSKNSNLQQTNKAEGSQSQGKKEEEKKNKSYELRKSLRPENQEKLDIYGIWKFPPVPISKQHPDFSRLDLRFLEKIEEKNYSSIGKKEEKDWLGEISKLFKTTYNLGETEDYYLVGTRSRLWNYKIGEEVKLFEITKQQRQESQSQVSSNNQLTSDSSGTQSQEENKELTSFEIVAGVIAEKPLSSKCYADKLEWSDLLQWEAFQQKIRSMSYKNSLDPDERFCEEVNKNIPPSTIILVGHDLKESQTTI